MRKGLVAVGATLLAVLAPVGVSSASHQEGGNQGSPQDFAVGAGTTGSEDGTVFGATQVAFAAHGGPTTLTLGGDPVTGHFRSGGELLDQTGANPTEFQFEGPVTCLVVERNVAENRNEARLFYPIKQARPELDETSGVLIFLRDNGPPKNGKPVDEIGFVFPVLDGTPKSDPPSEQDSQCVLPRVVPFQKLQKGDFTIHDATTP